MRWRAWITLFLAPLLTSWALATEPAQSGGTNQLLWKIERSGVPPSWLFGTIHLQDPSVARLPEKASQALAHSRVVATELKLDDNSAATALLQAMLAPRPTLPRLLGERDYSRLTSALQQRGYPEPLTSRLQPWAAWMLLLQPVPPANAALPIDMQIAAEAQKRQIANIGLETPAEQLTLFQQIETPRLRRLILAALDAPQEMERELRELTTAYRRGDLEAMLEQSRQLDDASTPPEDRAWAKDWLHALNEARNQRMLARLQPQLAQGGVFVAVGALHLPGPDGLISLLRAQGYRVTPAASLSQQESSHGIHQPSRH